VAGDFVAQVSGVGALAEPARRDLYLYVAAQPEPVSRDQAAAGVGLPRHTAKFHLDKLVDEGLLETEFRRLSGRSGPGAGRPSKLYRRSSHEVSVQLPERRYDLAGQILAKALEDTARDGRPALDSLHDAAADAGRALAAATRPPAQSGAAGGPGTLEAVAEVLAGQGYEPRIEEGVLVLANCPFHALAHAHTQLVCGMNHDVIRAVLDELDVAGVTARLDPAPNRCCVTLGPAG
jgi:predicted ArsR family transcriptional regulator